MVLAPIKDEYKDYLQRHICVDCQGSYNQNVINIPSYPQRFHAKHTGYSGEKYIELSTYQKSIFRVTIKQNANDEIMTIFNDEVLKLIEWSEDGPRSLLST